MAMLNQPSACVRVPPSSAWFRTVTATPASGAPARSRARLRGRVPQHQDGRGNGGARLTAVQPREELRGGGGVEGPAQGVQGGGREEAGVVLLRPLAEVLRRAEQPDLERFGRSAREGAEA